MAGNLRKFVNPKFLNTVDLDLMRRLMQRHDDDLHGFDFTVFDQDETLARKVIKEFFAGPEVGYPDGLIADLHRVAELGTGEGMQIVLNEARRQGVILFPRIEGDAVEKHEAKHVVLHAYLHHPSIFLAAADFQALRAPSAMAEFRGPERDVDTDLTEDKKASFMAELKKLLEQDLHGDYCRLGSYEDEGEINLAVGHGTPVVTTSIVVGNREKIIPLSEMKYPVLRYSPTEGLLRIGGVAKARQADVAEIFAKHILMRPGFFSGKDARDLYTFDPIHKAGPDFAFDARYDDRVAEVRIVAAAADFFERNETDDGWRYVRTWQSKDPSGAALRHFRDSEVRFGRGWRLGEITFRVFFKTDTARRAQVTVRMKPPGTLAFRRTRFEKAIHTLVARNMLEKKHNADMAVDAAE